MVVAFIAITFVGYANLRQRSLAENLEVVNLISFQFKESLTPSEREVLIDKVENAFGVTACSINQEGTTASVMFKPNVISDMQIETAIQSSVQVERRDLSASGGCPVHQVSASVLQVVSYVDLRNHF